MGKHCSLTGETPGYKRNREMSSSLLPSDPAVRQGWGSSELQAASHFDIPMSHSFYISISFACEQGQKVSAVPWWVEGMGRSLVQGAGW